MTYSWLWVRMRKNWKEKHVDLAMLTAYLGDFFKTKDFEAIKGDIPTGYQILASDSPYFKVDGCASVKIEGASNDFTVNLELCTNKKKRSFPHSVMLESMFFGGYLTLRRLKSEEAWLKLEKEFWIYTENAVLQLSNSAKRF
jgi:hypothetical protein